MPVLWSKSEGRAAPESASRNPGRPSSPYNGNINVWDDAQFRMTDPTRGLARDERM